MINRKNILSKTHYGLRIFSYVLKQYPTIEKSVLSLNGKVCKPVNNPFLIDKTPSLQISIENNIAVYKDLQGVNFQGDVFDFAQMHFKSHTEDELLICINDALHLQLESKVSDYESRLEWASLALDAIPDTQWNPRFSYFKQNLFNLYSSKTIGIYDVFKMVTNDFRKSNTNTLRSLLTHKEQSIYKRKYFDYVTFSGVFTKRNNASLIKHSELLTIDIDNIQTESTLHRVKDQLLADSYFSTELLFTSPRGKGLKWIIEIVLEKATHLEYFKAVSNYLHQNYGVKVDASGADVSRACLLPYDLEAYVNPKYCISKV